MNIGVLRKNLNEIDCLSDDPVPDVILVIHRGMGEESFLVDQILREMAGKIQRALQRCQVLSLPAVLLHQPGADEVFNLCNEEVEIEFQDGIGTQGQHAGTGGGNPEHTNFPEHTDQQITPGVHITAIAVQLRQYLDLDAIHLDHPYVFAEFYSIMDQVEIPGLTGGVETLQRLQ